MPPSHLKPNYPWCKETEGATTHTWSLPRLQQGNSMESSTSQDVDFFTIRCTLRFLPYSISQSENLKIHLWWKLKSLNLLRGRALHRIIPHNILLHMVWVWNMGVRVSKYAQERDRGIEAFIIKNNSCESRVPRKMKLGALKPHITNLL